MSRIGKKPIPIPDGVEVNIEGNVITVKGPRGRLTRELPSGIAVVREDGMLLVKRPSDDRVHRALHGLVRTLVANMVEGVTKGYEKVLELSGVGYRASKQGQKLVLAVGYSHPVEVDPGEGMEIEVPTPTRIVVRGADKEKVGALAAAIRSYREPEPYKGKGIRYEGEKIRRKAGKTGGRGKK